MVCMLGGGSERVLQGFLMKGYLRAAHRVPKYVGRSWGLGLIKQEWP